MHLEKRAVWRAHKVVQSPAVSVKPAHELGLQFQIPLKTRALTVFLRYSEKEQEIAICIIAKTDHSVKDDEEQQ